MNYQLLRLFKTIILVVAMSSTVAQDLPKFKTRIKVSVSADENIKGNVTSYINRELRSLQGVELVDHHAKWELQVLSMEVLTKSGYKTGIVLSAVILSKFPNQILSTFVPDSCKDTVNKMTAHLYFYPDHWLRTGSTEDLKNLCNEIVADFDTKYL